MPRNRVNSGGVATGAFLRKTYEEALWLVERTVAYIENQAPKDRRQLSDMAVGSFTVECMRLTTRLMQIMAWLMLQRAVENGEISREEATLPKHRLAARSISEVKNVAGAIELPKYLLELLDESRRLYERVSRLEHMILQAHTEEPLVHGMLGRAVEHAFPKAPEYPDDG